MICIIAGTAAALISAAAFMKFKDIKSGEKCRNSAAAFTAAFIICAAADIITLYRMYENGKNIFTAFDSLFLIGFMFLLAAVDFKHRVIPNRYIRAAVIVKTAETAVQSLVTRSGISLFVSAAAGFVTGFAVTGIVSVISKQGLGAGDVKMFAAAGYFAGCTAVLDMLVYSALLCAVTAVVLLVSGKCRLRESIPMAPFAFAGTVLYMTSGI